MNYVLMSLLGLALVALACVGLLYGERQRQARLDEKANHAKCMAHIATVTSNTFVAARLHDIADEWDSVEGQSELRRVANMKYRPEGASVVALRLHEMADELAGELVVNDASA